jgi:hypothetical protein
MVLRYCRMLYASQEFVNSAYNTTARTVTPNHITAARTVASTYVTPTGTVASEHD